MSFTSITFWIALVVLTAVYYLVPKKFQRWVLLAGSLLFYLYTGWKPMLLIVGVATFVFSMALYFGRVNAHYETLIAENRDQKRQLNAECTQKKKKWLALSLVICFGILFVLKYYHVFESAANALSAWIPASRSLVGKSIILPLGLSYYTFQAVGYLIDVYRGKYGPETNYFQLLLFVSFFPQLIQGPISRYDQLGAQFLTEKHFDFERTKDALLLILWGFFQKLIIGDRLTIVRDTIAGNCETYPGFFLIFAALISWLKLYTDFSAGIDIANGVASILGIELPMNFNQPFFATSLSEFWSRWHMTLNNWWRDYVFYPLTLSPAFNSIGKKAKKMMGNNIGKKVPIFLSLIVVRFINATWHGLGANQIVSGIYHGLLVGFSFMLEPVFAKTNKALKVRTESIGWRIFQSVRTYLLISIPSLVSLARTWQDFKLNVTSLFCWNPWVLFDGSLNQLGISYKEWYLVLFGVLVLFAVDVCKEKGISITGVIRRQNTAFRWLLYYALIFLLLIFGAYGQGYDASSFMYAGF